MKLEAKITPELLVEWERNPAAMEAAFSAAFIERLKRDMRGRAETLAARETHGTGKKKPRGLLTVRS